jgi:hypothetical protein
MNGAQVEARTSHQSPSRSCSHNCASGASLVAGESSAASPGAVRQFRR